MSNLRIETHRITSLETSAVGPLSSQAPADSLLPPPASASVSDDAVAALAEMLAKLDQEDRKSCREREVTANGAQAKEDAAQVQAMHDKADHLRSEGLVAGLASIGEGVCEIGAGAMSVSSSAADGAAKDASSKALEATDATTKAGFDATAHASAAVARSDKMWSAVFAGSSKGLEGAGKIGAQQYQADAARDDADARSHGATSAAYERTSKLAHEDEMDARDATKRLMSWVKEMRDAQNGALSAAASYRA